jgi:hypothetical protein
MKTLLVAVAAAVRVGVWYLGLSPANYSIQRFWAQNIQNQYFTAKPDP